MYSRRTPISIKIEGGHGSQILSVSSFFCGLSLAGSEWLIPDTSYFTNPKPDANIPGLTFWPWTLMRYGIELNEINLYAENWMPPKKTKKPRHFLENNLKVFSWLHKNADLFPLNEQQVENFLNDFDVRSNFNVIHIRRGDYVRIGSRIIEHNSYLNLLRKMGKQLNPCTIIISDEAIEVPIQTEYRNVLEGKVIFCSSENLNSEVSHDLMRVADILVTGNSTFSYSAAILNQSASLILSPIKHANSTESSNPFTVLGDWYIYT